MVFYWVMIDFLSALFVLGIVLVVRRRPGSGTSRLQAHRDRGGR